MSFNRFALAAGLIACSALADPAPANQAQDIPLYISADRALVMLRIGDHPPVPVAFDTGTTDNILDQDYAAALHLANKGPAHVVDGATGKAVPGYLADLADARLEGVPITGRDTEIIDYKERDEVGVFGPNAFAGRLVVLDFANSRLRVMDKSAATLPTGPANPYLGDGDEALPSVTVELPGGLRVQAHLDTGSDGPLTLPMALAAKLPLKAPLQVVGQAKSASGVQPIYGARVLGTIRIGPVTLENPQVDFRGTGANVGLPVIRQMRVVLDPAERRDWVQAQAPGGDR